MEALKGKKTILVALGAIAYAIGAAVTGNMEWSEAINYLFVGGGAMAFRDAMPPT